MINPNRLFVFAGAGLSFSMPAALPMFVPMRTNLLEQLHLTAYLPTGDLASVADGLAPEPFMLALLRAHTNIEKWVTAAVSTGRPNAGHLALAQLVNGGTHVWTVNFDRLIEDADLDMPVIAWPQDPQTATGLLKPHGTAGGPLIFTSVDVLKPLAGTWRDRLASDLTDSDTVIFIGYRGQDLDLQPLWNELVGTKQVLWFDLPLDRQEEDRRRALLQHAAQAGLVTFPPPSAAGNPTGAFVQWCTDNTPVVVPPDLVRQLDETRTAVPMPSLNGNLAETVANVLTVLGDVANARANYVKQALTGPRRGANLAAATNLTLNYGGTGTALGLKLAALIPPIGSFRRIRTGLQSKRVTLLFNAGRHHDVMRMTRHLHADSLSTLMILRAGSQRMVGSLDDSIQQARIALSAALTEMNPVRTAHASLQLCYALMWSGQLEAARKEHDRALQPYAALAATRWVAWADVIDASLKIYDNKPEDALLALNLAEGRFTAEALVDGQVSTLTVRLTALRQAQRVSEFIQTQQRLEKLLEAKPTAGTYYARGHVFSREALTIEVSQFHLHHTADAHSAAIDALLEVSRSEYPVHSAIAHLALASGIPASGLAHARTSEYVATGIGAHRILVDAENIIASGRDRLTEIFYP
jgi:hypothetical protein